MAADGSDMVGVTNNRRPDAFPDWQPLGPETWSAEQVGRERSSAGTGRPTTFQ